jgi:hypothetical protein
LGGWWFNTNCFAITTHFWLSWAVTKIRFSNV